MSNTKGNKDKSNRESPLTASFDSTVLGPGSQIGQFRIEKELGRGAVGVVYLAHDTKLDREVAIKSLPEEVVNNPLVKSRFQREARLLAGLNHPNIATIHEEVEEVEGTSYLVLEYIAGDTLAERIEKGPLSLDDALNIGQQIAEAVAAAHEQGVIHRDLKPGNIKITPDGKVKVLDFGLAKAVGGEGADQESTITVPGRVIGTPAYMSPEQARGNLTDHRSDIWSFGCVLFEMLTGKIPFKGDTVSDTLANILQSSPEWEKLPGTAPANIKVLLRRCMEKDIQKRLRDIGDAALEISETIHLPKIAPPVVNAGGGISGPMSKRQLVSVRLVCFVVAVVGTGLIAWIIKPFHTTISISSPPTIHLPIDLRDQIPSIWVPEVEISPNGKHIAYTSFSKSKAGNQHIVLRRINEPSEGIAWQESAYSPFFSPKSDRIGFVAVGKVYIKSLGGGNPAAFSNVPTMLGGSWGKEGYTEGAIVLSIFGLGDEGEAGIYRISDKKDFDKRILVKAPDRENGELFYSSPQILPGGKELIFTIWKTDLDNVSVAVLNLETTEYDVLIRGGSNGRYVATRTSKYLIYAQKGELWAVPFNLNSLEVEDANKFALKIKVNQTPDIGKAPFSISDDGTLVYIKGGDWLAQRRIMKVDQEGNIIDENILTKTGAYKEPRLSPDGKQLAYTLFENGTYNIYVYDLETKGAPNPLASKNSFNPLWRPKYDKWVAFTSYKNGSYGIFLKQVDSGVEKQPLGQTNEDLLATSWSPDGKFLLYTNWSADTLGDIWKFEVDKEGNLVGEPEVLVNTEHDEFNAFISPDGEWFVYSIIEKDTGKPDVYVKAIDGSGQPIKISDDIGGLTYWSPKEYKIIYQFGKIFKSVTYEIESGKFIKGKPRIEFEVPDFFYGGNLYRCAITNNYDISDEGEFFMIKESEDHPENELFIFTNFFDELKRLDPANKN